MCLLFRAYFGLRIDTDKWYTNIHFIGFHQPTYLLLILSSKTDDGNILYINLNKFIHMFIYM